MKDEAPSAMPLFLHVAVLHRVSDNSRIILRQELGSKKQEDCDENAEATGRHRFS